MNLYPFHMVVARGQALARRKATFYQQFVCARCGTKQTMSEPNQFWTEGICEECEHITNILEDGCNLMVVFGPHQSQN